MREIVEAAARQARELSFVYNQQLSAPAQEPLRRRARRRRAGPGLDRVHFVTGGSEANETALRLAYHYHVERGEPGRTRTVSQAQAYHGADPRHARADGSARPVGAVRAAPARPASTCRPRRGASTPAARARSAALDAQIAEHGADSIGAFVCEPVSAAALPAYAPPQRFWEGLAERREQHGFLIVLDEVVTGIGRTGAWLASHDLPLVPDIVTTAKGLGAGYSRDRRGAVRRARLRRRGRGLAGVRARAHLGRRAAVVRRRARGAGVPAAARARGARARARPACCAMPWRRRSRAASSCARCAAAASCWAWSTSTRGTARRSSTRTCGWPGGSTTRRWSATSSSTPRSRRVTATPATRPCWRRRSSPPTRSRSWSSSGWSHGARRRARGAGGPRRGALIRARGAWRRCRWSRARARWRPKPSRGAARSPAARPARGAPGGRSSGSPPR